MCDHLEEASSLVRGGLLLCAGGDSGRPDSLLVRVCRYDM